MKRISRVRDLVKNRWHKPFSRIMQLPEVEEWNWWCQKTRQTRQNGKKSQGEACSRSTSLTRHRGTQMPKRLHRCPSDQTALSAAGQKSKGNEESCCQCLWNCVLLYSAWFPCTAAGQSVAWTLQTNATCEVAQDRKDEEGEQTTRLGTKELLLRVFREMRLLHLQPPCSPSRYLLNWGTPPYHIWILKIFQHWLK